MPVCTDCHGGHAIADPHEKQAMMSSSCATCHDDVYQVYAQSVHGKALVQDGNQDVPAAPTATPRTRSWTRRRPPSTSVAGDLHPLPRRRGADAELPDPDRGRHHLPLGLPRRHGDPRPSRRSRGAPAGGDLRRLPRRARHRLAGPDEPERDEGQGGGGLRGCHEGAAQDFPAAWLSHFPPSLDHAPLVFLVNLFYKVLIPFMLVGLALQVGLHLYRVAAPRGGTDVQARPIDPVDPIDPTRPRNPASGQDAAPLLEVGDLPARVDHLLFTLLLLTGLPQKWPQLGISQWTWTRWAASSRPAGSTALSGIAFALLTLAHLLVAVGGVRDAPVQADHAAHPPGLPGHGPEPALVPGQVDKAPRFGRYDYRQKFEYWGLIFGSAIMVVTGFILSGRSWSRACCRPS